MLYVCVEQICETSDAESFRRVVSSCRQLRRMGREKRWVVSLCFVLSMFLTLLVSWQDLSWLLVCKRNLECFFPQVGQDHGNSMISTECLLSSALQVAFLPGQWHGRTLILLLLVLIQWASLVPLLQIVPRKSTTLDCWACRQQKIQTWRNYCNRNYRNNDPHPSFLVWAMPLATKVLNWKSFWWYVVI